MTCVPSPGGCATIIRVRTLPISGSTERKRLHAARTPALCTRDFTSCPRSSLPLRRFAVSSPRSFGLAAVRNQVPRGVSFDASSTVRHRNNPDALHASAVAGRCWPREGKLTTLRGRRAKSKAAYGSYSALSTARFTWAAVLHRATGPVPFPAPKRVLLTQTQLPGRFRTRTGPAVRTGAPRARGRKDSPLCQVRRGPRHFRPGRRVTKSGSA